MKLQYIDSRIEIARKIETSSGYRAHKAQKIGEEYYRCKNQTYPVFYSAYGIELYITLQLRNF